MDMDMDMPRRKNGILCPVRNKCAFSVLELDE